MSDGRGEQRQQPEARGGHGLSSSTDVRTGPDGVASARSGSAIRAAAARFPAGTVARRIAARTSLVGRSGRLVADVGGAPRPRRGAIARQSGTIACDVRTDRAARRAPRDQRPAPGGALGLDRRLRAGGVAARDRRPGRRRPLHGAPHLQGHDRLPVDPRDQRGDRGRRRLVQRRHGSRIDRLLGARPAPRGGPRDGRHRRADRPAAARGRRHRERARGHHRGDPLVPRRPVRVLPDPVPDRDVRRRSAGARDLRRGVGHPGPAGRGASTTSGGAAYRPANTVVAVVGDLGHDEAVGARPRPAFGTGNGVGPGLRPGAGPAGRPAGPRPASATRARPRSASASRPSIATTRTAGRWPSSTRSSATA